MTKTREDSPVLWDSLIFLRDFLMLTLVFGGAHWLIVYFFDLVCEVDALETLHLGAQVYLGFYDYAWYNLYDIYNLFIFYGPYLLLKITFPLMVSYFLMVTFAIPPLKSVKCCVKMFLRENRCFLLTYVVVHLGMCLVFPWLPSMSNTIQLALISTLFSFYMCCVLLFSLPSQVPHYLGFNVSRNNLFWSSNLAILLVTTLIISSLATFSSIGVYICYFNNNIRNLSPMFFLEHFLGSALETELVYVIGREDFFSLGLICFLPLFFFTAVISVISGIFNSKKLRLNPWLFGLIMVAIYVVVIYLGLGANPFQFFFNLNPIILFVGGFALMEGILCLYVSQLHDL